MTDSSDQSLDPRIEAELNAMQAILDAFRDLSDAARSRILRWACDRYGVVA